MIRGLIEGDYTLSILPNELYLADTLENITTVKGQVTTVAPVVLKLVPESDD